MLQPRLMRARHEKVTQTTKNEKPSTKAAARPGQGPATASKARPKHANRAAVTIDDVLPPGSWQRVAAGVAAAAGGGLLAAAAVGVGPAALAAAAGYLAYRGLHGGRTHVGATTQPKG